MKRKTAAIIQARMGSTRLPGKVMMDLSGKPILAYLCDRLLRARTLDNIVVATSVDRQDDVIAEECERRGILLFRGCQYDVLGRYAGAAKAFAADVIVRVTADNPFTDPESIDRVVDHIARTGTNYALEMSLPVGTTGEAITRDGLQAIDAVAYLPRHREHVTLYAKEHPNFLSSAFLDSPSYNRPDLRFTIDYPADLAYVRQLSETLSNADFALKELIALADELAVEAV